MKRPRRAVRKRLPKPPPGAGEPIRLSRVAGWCHVSHVAAFKWVRSGKLKAFQTPGGQYRVIPSDCRAFLEGHGFPVPEELTRAEGERCALVVEDNASFADLLALRLRDATGWTVYICRDGMDACLRIGVLRPALVALDLHLPGLDGLQVCRRIREHPALAGTRIVAMTADSREGIPRRLYEAGADAVLLKPFQFENFCMAAGIGVRERAVRPVSDVRRPAVDLPPGG